MKIIEGKYARAVIYTDVVEETALQDIQKLCDQPFAQDSQIRIMPDVHAGKGCTIGTTMTVTDKVVPNIVGVDIGCGMYTVNLGKAEIDFARLDEVCNMIPSGTDVWEGRSEKCDLTVLRCYRSLKDTRRIQRSLGTLGGGNHFIEVDEGGDGTRYLVIHSGSRNLGKQVAEYYQSIAVELHKGREEYFNKRDEIIASYKAAGRKSEIEEALKKLKSQWQDRQLTIPEELCFLYGRYLDDYLHDLDFCQKFAVRNREKIAEFILEKMGLKAEDSFHTIHNYIDVEEKILRKGAIAAHQGEKILIPINMRDGSILAYGKGNPDWNFSAPHGAGRKMSRGNARENISLAEFEKSMQGIYTTSVNENTIDESPQAYKSLADIIDNITEAVEVIEVIRPLYNFKAH
ncbi:MAG: RtcB family protein [Erysipelotrichaceae bacterium]|nr:RtcB family protein [Erysipelotrichaceae bacterium]